MVGLRLGLGGVVGVLPAVAERAAPADSAAPALTAVRALLDHPITSAAEARADLARLSAARAVWQAAPPAVLLIEQRRAGDFTRLAAPDSAYAALLRARRAGQTLRHRYPLEVSRLWADVAGLHWSAARLDSAGHYFRAAASLVEAAGFDLRATAPLKLADGSTSVPSAEAASKWGNAGLVDRRRGGPTAVRVLAPLLALYRQQNARLKLRDTYALLEAAYARAGRADSTYAYAQRYRQLDVLCGPPGSTRRWRLSRRATAPAKKSSASANSPSWPTASSAKNAGRGPGRRCWPPRWPSRREPCAVRAASTAASPSWMA